MKEFLKDWWILLIMGIGFIVFMVFFTIDIIKDHRIGNAEKDYCGYVIDKGYDPPSSGYKSHTDAQYWVVIQDEDCHKGIRVHVTPGAFYDARKDERICFTLSAYELKWYGNTNELKHLK